MEKYTKSTADKSYISLIPLKKHIFGNLRLYVQ